MGIVEGSIITYNADPSIMVKVVSDKKVEYQGEETSLTTITWEVYSTQEFDNDGYLVDFQDNSIKLISTTDVITDYEGNESEYLNENICQWVIVYKIKKVLRLHNPVQLEDSATD